MACDRAALMVAAQPSSILHWFELTLAMLKRAFSTVKHLSAALARLT